MKALCGYRRALLVLALLTAVCFECREAAAQTVPLEQNHPRDVSALKGWREAPADKELDLRVYLALRKRAELDNLLAAQQNPSSPQYHQWLSPQEFGERFGPKPDDFKAIEQWLKSQGFVPSASNEPGRYIELKAPVWRIGRALGVTIVAAPSGDHYGNLKDPVIPAQFQGVIAHIDGLDNLRRLVPLIRRPAALPKTEDFQPEVTLDGDATFGPDDFYTFYDEAPLLNAGFNGAGDCVALVEDSNAIPDAVTAFNQSFGLPGQNISMKFVDGTDPGTNDNETEALLDIEWSHVAAPGADQVVYIGDLNTSTTDPITDATQAAVSDDRCGTISISFAHCGNPVSFFRGILDPIFSQAAAQGQSVFVSAGDQGAAGLVIDPSSGMCVAGDSPNVSEMSADPYVTSVGGTEFTPDYDSSGDDLGFVPEAVWDEPPSNYAGGGGASSIFFKPGYQQEGTPADGVRDVPDVAMIASTDMPGVVIVADQSGTLAFELAGGTSLAAPLWAGIAALIEQEVGGRLGNLNPRIYELGPLEDFANVGLRDVTTGNNSYNGVTGFTAGPLYDQASGWGSADISDFVLAYPVARASLVVKPKSLNFPKEAMAHGGALSPFKILTIYNPANAIQDSPIRLEGLGISGDTSDFVVDDNCPTVLTAGGQCEVTLQFIPTALGQRRAALVISGNAINAPEQVDLNGIGVPAVLTYHPSALGFGRVAIGTTSVAKTVTLINRNAVGIDISAISVYNPDFTAETTCSDLLPALSSCTVAITFAPSVTGKETGSLIVEDDAAGNQQVVRLNGIGTAS